MYTDEVNKIENRIVEANLFRQRDAGMRNAHQVRSESLALMLKAIPAVADMWWSRVARCTNRRLRISTSSPEPRHLV